MILITEAIYAKCRYRGSFILLAAMLLSSCSFQHRIQQSARLHLLSDSLCSQGDVGICIYEPATRRYWLQYQDDHYFLPGSNTKLFTLYAALHCLGDSVPALRYRYLSDSTLQIFPTGDPTLLSPRFVTQPVRQFLQGQQKVSLQWRAGPSPFAPGWSWEDFTEAFMPARSVMPVYENKATVRYASGGDQRVEPAGLSDLFDGYSDNKWPGNLFPSDKIQGDTGLTSVPFANDAALTEKLLEQAIPGLRFTKASGAHLTQQDSSRSINTLYSRPLDSLLAPMMLVSDNFYSEQLLSMAANEFLGAPDQTQLIDTLLNTALGFLADRPVWIDGSGLSRYNLCTPRSLVSLLDSMQSKWGLARIQRLLPTGGKGTLRNYFKSDNGFIFAKTGTLRHQNALSGFLYTRKNKLLIFSVLINNVPGKASAMRKATERFLINIRSAN
jgi:D-alanyl-D-alanine carboxypeptidase/D-alanyl-D-alanine-endopeptidase (penicillin-binding protein 4)